MITSCCGRMKNTIDTYRYNIIASDQNLEKRWMLTILSRTSDLFGGWFFGGLSGRRTVHTLYGLQKLKVPCFAMEDHG